MTAHLEFMRKSKIEVRVTPFKAFQYPSSLFPPVGTRACNVYTKIMHRPSSIKSSALSLTLLLILLHWNQPISAAIDSMIELLIEQINIHQVIAVIKEARYAGLESAIYQRISSRYPTRTLSFDEARPLQLNRSSILFVSTMVTTEPPYETELEFTKTLRQMAWDTFDSRFLIFVLSSGSKDRPLDYLLKFAWQTQLINVILYEINVDPPNTSQKNGLHNPLSIPGTIHRYNPFTDNYTREVFHSNSTLYPNMVNDLNGYQLRIGLVHYPPYSDIVVNEEKRTVEYKAVFGSLVTTIRKALNFTMIPVIRSLAEYGVLLPNGSATGLLADVKDGKIDAIAFGAFYFYSPFTVMLDRTSYLSLEEACPVVPMIPTTSILLDTSFVVSCVTIIILVTAIWLFTFLLKPDQENNFIWNPLSIGFLILGVTVPGQPTNLRERLVFGCILVVSLFYSSNVFAQLTSVSLNTNSFKDFESYEDLEESGLIPIVHPNMYSMTFGFGDEMLQKLGKRAESRPDYAEYCPNRLLTTGDVVCVIEDLCARFLISQSQSSSGEMKMKFGKPCFWSATRAYILRKASPYTWRFNDVIMHIVESGIATRWWLEYSGEKRNTSDSLAAEGDQDNIVDELKDTSYKGDFFFVLFGNVVSICVFVAELFIFNWRSLSRLFRRICHW